MQTLLFAKVIAVSIVVYLVIETTPFVLLAKLVMNEADAIGVAQPHCRSVTVDDPTSKSSVHWVWRLTEQLLGVFCISDFSLSTATSQPCQLNIISKLSKPSCLPFLANCQYPHDNTLCEPKNSFSAAKSLRLAGMESTILPEGGGSMNEMAASLYELNRFGGALFTSMVILHD